MDRNEILKLIRDEIKAEQTTNQYGVARVPAHTHNGIDSTQIHFEDLGNASQYGKLARITLTPAQVKALHTTPITLVPAPQPAATAANSRQLVIVDGIEGFISFNTTAYTGANAMEFRYTGASGAKVTADVSTTFLNSASTTYVQVGGVVTELVPVSNAPVTLSVPVANPGAGDSTITLIVKYHLALF